MGKNTRPWEDRWRVIKRLDKGGQGLTHIVEDQSTGQPAVMKELKFQDRPAARGRMLQEVTNLKILHNIGCRVPGVLDSNVEHFEDLSVHLYFVMEQIVGQTLAQTVETDGPFAPDVAIAITKDLLETTAKGLSQNILHRDIKPENLILRSVSPPDVVVLDYGISFNAANGQDNALTQAGETLDNKFLSLSERRVFGGNRRDPRSDLTGICGILFYCLTGHPPVDLVGPTGEPPHRRKGCSLEEILLDEPRLSLLQAFFDCGFSPSVETRFQTPEELLERLDGILEPRAAVADVDPSEIARRCSIELAQNDRPTQLHVFSGKLGNRLSEAFQKAINPYRHNDRLGDFDLNVAFDKRYRLEAPEGFELLDHPGVTLTLCHAAHRDKIRLLAYTFASKSLQCAIIRTTGLTRGNVGHSAKTPDPKTATTEVIAWWEGDSGPDDLLLELLMNDIKASLGSMIQAVSRDILGAQIRTPKAD